ncbi:sulfatase [Candidatus Latescibacterota bacterium]
MSDRYNRNPNRREALKQGLAGAAGLAGTSLLGGLDRASAAPGKRPNVIIFHTDDQDFNTLGCYGYDVMTPNIDTLAGGGICFNRGYVTTGVCNAARYALVTGEYPSRCRTPAFKRMFPKDVPTEPSFNTNLAEGQETIASAVKRAGYKTGFVGKWHLGFDRDRMKRYERSKEMAPAWRASESDVDPKDPKINDVLVHNQQIKQECVKRYGFDYAAAVCNNPEGMGSRNLNVHNPEWVTEAAINFIDQSQDDPFFLYLNHTLHHIPHPQDSLLNGDPRVTEGGYLDRIPDVMPSRREIYERVVREGYRPETAYCTWMDEALGAVMNRLGELNISDNTLILFIADNNVPAKGTIYEDGVRVPLIARYPNMVRGAQRSAALVQNIDFVPTVFDLCGATAPDSMNIDGENMMPLLTGETDRIHDELFFEIGWTRGCCTDRWKYLALRHPESAWKRREKRGGIVYHGPALEPHQHNALLWHPMFFNPDQLYDMNVDPHETVDLSGRPEYANVLSDMKDRTGRWLRTFDNPFGEFTG